MSSHSAIGAGAGPSPFDLVEPPSANAPTRESLTVLDISEDLDDIDPEVIEQTLNDLVSADYLEKSLGRDDCVLYTARHGLSWSHVSSLSNSIKRRILIQLIENPKTFFVLYNTQAGKAAIVSKEIKLWSAVLDKKVVAFLVVDNDKTLADQSEDGLRKSLESDGKVFLLSSGAKEKITVDNIRTYIDAYAGDTDGEYKMPVVVALNNDDQIKKILSLMQHIKVKVETRASPLRYGVVFDEADKVYPTRRSKDYAINGTVVSFKRILVDNDIAVHRLGFVTATDGELLDPEEFEECANAYHYDAPDPPPEYRAIHHRDAVIKYAPHKKSVDNDAYAEAIIRSNAEYFKSKIKLKNGSDGFRKIIVNGASRTASMASFARRRTSDGFYAITLNMNGVTVYRPGESSGKIFKTKGKRLGELLFQVYTDLNLHDKPLIIVGRKKVDRGLGFHWAPPDGSDGLIWTDMILGRIEDKDTAVQKAGRLAGRVAQCPQYPALGLTWWTDERTANSVTRHNAIVDAANSKRDHSILQAVTSAMAEVPENPVVTTPKFKLSLRTFDTVQDAKNWWKDPESVLAEPHDVRFGITQYRIYENEEGKCIKYRGGLRRIISEAAVRSGRMEIAQGTVTAARIMPVIVGQDLGREGNGVARILPVLSHDLQWGIASSARIMPVEASLDSVKFIVVYKPDAVYQPRAGGAGTDDESSE